MQLEEFVPKMPKIELHVHLEGSIQPSTLLHLAKKNHVSLPSQTLKEISQWFTFSNISHLFEVYPKICECIQTPEDIEYITKEFLKGQSSQNILYSEVTYTASNQWYDNGIPLREQIEAINRSRHWAEKKLNTSMGLIIDIPRQLSPDQGLSIAQQVVESQNLGIIGLGLGGNERDYPPAIFQDAFEYIKGTPIHSVPHAGEMAGPQSIWDSIHFLGAERIGHGVRCGEDPMLMDFLREHQIPLEICPTSNICLGIYEEFQNHPINQLFQAGLNVSINSDDPTLFNTTLTQEFLTLISVFNYSLNDLKRFTVNAINASFSGPEMKEDLFKRIKNEFSKFDD
ncbi:Adenine deaminase [Candidatus Lokiarchaeum ossiferum]|uniref:Adenine deaminase n=1 Tax=Candidatus Lokiarchaeum ossiferum TaxID=2951803 RepID=A0ABY6HRS6_9ARCH|nr:Adenine deaminase [Candidatus Lokiarchaeum sp. B-35]